MDALLDGEVVCSKHGEWGFKVVQADGVEVGGGAGFESEEAAEEALHAFLGLPD